MTQIDTVHTPCKDCVFAIYENKTQTNCALNYIDLYRNNNIEILEAYDEDKEFLIINKKKCIGYREPKWFEQFNMSNSTIEDKIIKFNETNKLNYLLIIDLLNFTIESFRQLCYNISRLDIKPQQLIIIRHIDDKLNFPYESISSVLQNSNIKWRIQTMVDNSINHNQIIHNLIIINPKYRFVCSINNYIDNLNELINNSNRIVHEDLDQFIVLSSKNKYCLIFSSILYRYNILDGKNILTDTSQFTII